MSSVNDIHILIDGPSEQFKFSNRHTTLGHFEVQLLYINMNETLQKKDDVNSDVVDSIVGFHMT